MEFNRTVVTFFVIFLTVYFLEAIGGFYMTSAIVSIERQFQIPSKVSGLMVSAGDFGYIPSVVFVSYLGGKGNRARWIGGGCVLIAVANMLISASNFLFPVETVSLDNSVLQNSLEMDTRRLNTANISLHQFLRELSPNLREGVEQKIPAVIIPPTYNTSVTPALASMVLNYDESWLSQFDYCGAMTAQDPTCEAFYDFLRRHNSATKADIDNLRILSATSYAFCDRALNKLRSMIQAIRCTQNISNVGPTATIFIGLLMLGVGRTMPFSLGLPLVDDNVKKKNLPLYLAGMFFIRIMGPVMGFMMGSFFNKFYYTTDPPRGITPRDPMWIGMWWGGFLTIGIALFFPSLALFCFRAPEPENEEESTVTDEEEGQAVNGKKQLLDQSDLGVGKDIPKPTKTKNRGLALVDRHAEKGLDGNTVVPTGFGDKVKDFFETVQTVLKQPIYAGSLVGRILDVMAFKGFYIFLPKYLELQFGIPQYKINMYMGFIGVVGFAVGVLCGSVVLKVWKLEGRKVAAWVAVCSGLAACLSFMNANVGCRSTLTALGESLPNNFNMNSTCLSGCGCEGVPLYPVCDTQGTVYYSPCHAGCKLNAAAFTALDPKMTPTFNDCRCANTGNAVSRDFCEETDCSWKVVWYFLNMAISGVIGGMGVVPGVLIMLRSVPPRHRSVSLGFNGFLVSLFATLPSPIAWGTVIDLFCIHWDKKCGERGACSLYATDELRVWLHCIYGMIRMISLVTDIYVVYHAKDLKITDSQEEDEKADLNNGAKHAGNSNNISNLMSSSEKGNSMEKEPLKVLCGYFMFKCGVFS
ncbi:organic anion transporter polypeptide (OATP) family domain-containing protein [Ditylenchus destructor]|uniref:Solute carrier organic anion transporter family member n=1 Tax=Ditylenchus destructor TaxID=166010 RepID=A0AAD4MX06_9BILA|nr:organic anion transporter polypeptide (OATP) family domain-containing protein [Ditylenchus destructor]